MADAGALTDTVINNLLHKVRGGAVERDDIAREALVALDRFDGVAATHYGAFHPIKAN